MKKVQFKHLIKTIMFLSLLVSVITIQHVSAQTSPSVNNKAKITWKLIDKDGNEIQVNKDDKSFPEQIDAVDPENASSCSPNSDTVQNFIIHVKYDGYNKIITKVGDVDVSNIEFLDQENNKYRVLSIERFSEEDKPIKLDKANVTEFTVKNKQGFAVYLNVEKIVKNEEKKEEDEPELHPTHHTEHVDIQRFITVHFHKENGAPDSIAVVDIGGKLLPTQLPKIEKEGYEFLGWYYKASDEYKLGPRGLDDELLPFDLNRSIYADINLYAKWKQKEVVPEEPKKAVPNTADC